MENCQLYKITTKESLLKIIELSNAELKQVLNNSYKSYIKNENEKKRLIEEPNDDLKKVLTKLLIIFQQIPSCEYNKGGVKGEDNIKNAQKHINFKEVITVDIYHFFPKTQEKYVRIFFQNELKISGDALDILVRLTTFNGHLPTGAPTSPILAFLVHKCLFNRIYNKMCKHNISMTLYIDDITLSSKQHIGNWVITYIEDVLKQHGLFLNKSKIKRFGYKNAWVTGVKISQSGKIDVSWHKGYSIIQSLKTKELKKMNLLELQKLLGKITYFQKFYPEKFVITRKKILKKMKFVSS